MATMGPRNSAFLMSEGNGYISRDVVTVAAGQTLEPGTVLADDGAGKKVAWDGTAGTEESVLLSGVDASGADVDAVAIARLAEVDGSKLIAPAQADLSGSMIVIR